MTMPTNETPGEGAQAATASQPRPTRRTRPPLLRRHPWVLAGLGLLLVAAAVAVQAAGIAQASDGNWERGTLLAWVSIGVSALAFAAGLVAVILRRVWRLGLLVMVLALLANPYLLTRLLDALG